MASEYLKWKYRDVKPDEPVVLTKEQKRKNWWDYHKWHVVIGVILLAAFIDIGAHALGIGKVKPDYQFAYVGSTLLPEDTVAALEVSLGELGGDPNGDGKNTVIINQYVTAPAETGADAANYAAASAVKLMADLDSRESCFFILEDPETFQRNYDILRNLDGTLPDGTESGPEEYSLRWADCPVLAGLELGGYTADLLGETVEGDSQELLGGMYIARRGFWTKETAANNEGCEALWETITEGAAG